MGRFEHVGELIIEYALALFGKSCAKLVYRGPPLVDSAGFVGHKVGFEEVHMVLVRGIGRFRSGHIDQLGNEGSVTLDVGRAVFVS